MIKAGDVVAVREKAKKQLRIQQALDLSSQRGRPDWVDVDGAKMEGKFKQLPERTELPSEINESLIIELYSR